MHLLLCNDDGYQAKGLQILCAHLESQGHRVTVVAPSGQRSAQSHSMSFYQAVQVEKISSSVFSVNGTPADCVAIGLSHILKNSPPDFVLSGINHGLNVGIDVNYSGTVGAATEAALMGHRAIAVSMDIPSEATPEETHTQFNKTSQFIGQILEHAHLVEWPKFEVLNVNAPFHAKGFRSAECGGESLYIPGIEEITPKKQENIKLYLIGGGSRYEPKDMSQDVSLVSSGYVTLSFVRAKQGSTQSNLSLSQMVPHLKL